MPLYDTGTAGPGNGAPFEDGLAFCRKADYRPDRVRKEGSHVRANDRPRMPQLAATSTASPRSRPSWGSSR